MNALAQRPDYLCRCEEVTVERVAKIIAEGTHTLNDIKRRSRVGMGPCQGVYCLSAAQQLLEEVSERPDPMTSRPPARHLRLGELADFVPE